MVAESPPLKLRRVILEPTNACNIRCSMCAQTARRFSVAMMGMGVFDKMLPTISDSREAVLFGWGEPLLNIQFGTMFEKTAATGTSSYVTTNGTRLTDGIARLFVEQGLTYLAMSLDGAKPETYNRIRLKSDFDTVVGNFAEVPRLKKELNVQYPHTRLTMVLMRDNIGELPDLVDLAARLGANEVKGVYLVAYGPDQVYNLLYFYPHIIESYFKEAERRAKANGVVLNLPSVIQPHTNTITSLVSEAKNSPPASGSVGPIGCDDPFTQTFVGARGQVRACMISPTILGDLTTQEFGEIWHGEQYENFRRRIKSESPPAECVACHQCSHLDVNKPEAHLAINFPVPQSQLLTGK